jgi:predicted ABC-type ATPase
MRLLSDSDLDRLYTQRIRSQLFGSGGASSSPKLVIVGGQPGAGKTLATLSAARELASTGDGVAYINGDELRPLHPRYVELVAKDNTTAADKTAADVGLWVERGIREAVAGRFSTVIETTMRQPEVVRATAKQFTNAGFEFELRVVVVDPELSSLAIYERFARGLETPGALPRYTLPSYHSDALEKMPTTLGLVSQLASTVRFIDRQGRELYSSRVSSKAPVAALEDLRRQSLPADQQQRIAQQWNKLVQRLDRVGGPDVVRQQVLLERNRVMKLL